MKDKLLRLGEKIAIRRKKLGYSQEYLAELVGVHRNYIGYIERGERCVSLLRLWAIADILKIEMSELFK